MAIIYFRWLGTRVRVSYGVSVNIRVRVDFRVMVVVSKLLGSDYCQGKFRVIVRVRVRLWF